MKEPTVAVPVTVLLELVRLYKENPQEVLNRTHYVEACNLERRAYRKYLGWKAELRKEKRS